MKWLQIGDNLYNTAFLQKVLFSPPSLIEFCIDGTWARLRPRDLSEFTEVKNRVITFLSLPDAQDPYLRLSETEYGIMIESYVYPK